MSTVAKSILTVTAIVLLGCNSRSQSDFQPEEADAFEETPANISHVLQIAKDDEPGERLVIKGRVFESDGITPAPNVIMYCYHANAKGVYAKRGNEPRNSLAWWHGYNRGWLKTNSQGAYEIRTIKPAPYPERVEPAHIHCNVLAPTQKKGYPIDAIVSRGDELITEEYLYKVEQNGHPRDSGVVLRLNDKGVWEGRKDFVLYAQYDKGATNSGLLKGEECPAFQPRHIWGPDKGSSACPMCKYGNKQGIMAWINTDEWSNVASLAAAMEKEMANKGVHSMRAFIIYMNPKNLPEAVVQKELQQFAKGNNLKHVAILSIPSPMDEKTAGLYRINPNTGVSNTVFVYKNRRVMDKVINFQSSEESLSRLFNAIYQPMPSK